jgi:peroxiredoxin
MNPRPVTTARAVTLGFLLLVATASAACAQQTEKDHESRPSQSPDGPSVVPEASTDPAAHVLPDGPAPDFELEGTVSRPVRLSSLRGDWIALVFSERITDVTSLRTIDNDMRRMGVRIVSVCHEKLRRVRSQSKHDSLSFLVLADPSGQVGALYDLRDANRTQTLPGFFLLNRQGVVKLAHPGEPLDPVHIWQLTHDFLNGS